MRRPTPRSSSSFSSSLCPKVSASTPSSTPPCCHHWSKKSITVRISWARHGAPGGTEADHQAVLKRQRSRGGGQLMAISAGGPAGEGHPSWGRDIRLRDVKAAEDPPGSPWRTAMGLLEVFGRISWARHGAPGGTEADHQAVLKRQRSRGGGQLMAISAGGPAGEGHPSWG
ncbi:unnamed protein product [Boreogadus saida]